jgi:hypothetical protein
MILAVTAGLLVPAAAQAERWHGSDDAGDVAGWHLDPEPEPCGTSTSVDASANTNEDITDLVVSHQRKEVKLVVRFRDLYRELEQRVSIHLTTGRRKWVLEVHRFRDFDADIFQVSAFLGRGPAPIDGEDAEEGCAVAVRVTPTSCLVRPRLDLRANTLRAEVPRSCLKRPRWVRVGARATGDGTVDDWGTGGSSATPWLPPFGPKVAAP